MKTALIAGDNGFIGRHMKQRLKTDGWSVRGFDIATTEEDAVNFFRYNSGTVYDLVINCAAEVGGRAHIDGTNMALAHNLAIDAAYFDWAVRTKQRALIYYSSSAAYPTYFQTKASHTILQEDDLNLDFVGQPDSNYGLAKVVGERLAQTASENGVRVHVLRPFSGYGEDQSLDYPFPSIIQRAKHGDLTVWGPLGQMRDWIHVDDVIGASLAVYENDDRRPVNICTGVGTEMGALMLMAKNLISPGREPSRVIYNLRKPTGVFYRVGDPTRMLESYQPKISLEDGIRRALQIQEV